MSENEAKYQSVQDAVDAKEYPNFAQACDALGVTVANFYSWRMKKNGSKGSKPAGKKWARKTNGQSGHMVIPLAPARPTAPARVAIVVCDADNIKSVLEQLT